MADGKMGFDREEYMVFMHEVIKQLLDAGYKNNVEITSDSCYSGLLCLEAQKLWMKDLEQKETGKPRDCKITEFKRFKIDASTSPDKKAIWGQFTQYKKIKNSGHCTDVDISIATNDYVEQFGLAEFSSRCLKDSHTVETNECKDLPGIWFRTKRTKPEDLPYDLEKETQKYKEKYSKELTGNKF